MIVSMSTFAFANESKFEIDRELIGQSLEQIIENVGDEMINEDSLRETLYEKEIQSYMHDTEFQKAYEENPQLALKMIEQNVENQLDFIKTYQAYSVNSGNENGAWVDPILIMQKNSYFCGPCSALQAIAIYGGSVSGASNNAKQDTLAAAMGTDATGTYVYKVTNTLNKYVPGYSYKLGGELTDFSFKYTVLNSLINEKAPILHARTKYLEYYNGHNTGHYICVTAINNVDNLIRLSDCNNNSKYYGTRSIPRVQAFNSITKEPERYLISSSML